MTTATLTLSPVAASDAGGYDVVVADGCSASTTSSPAALTITLTPPLAPGNILEAARSGADVTMAWPSVSGAASYNIKRCDAGSGPCTPAFYGTPGTPFFIDPAVPAGFFWYALEAVNACGATP